MKGSGARYNASLQDSIPAPAPGRRLKKAEATRPRHLRAAGAKKWPPASRDHWCLIEGMQEGSRPGRLAQGILDRTAVISSASGVAGQTLKLISASLADPANAAPRGVGGEYLMHRCQFCTEVAPAIAKVSEALDGGVAVALASARQEIATQFGPEARKGLQGTLRQATVPLVDLKNTMRGSFGPLVKADDIQAIQTVVDTQLFAGLRCVRERARLRSEGLSRKGSSKSRGALLRVRQEAPSWRTL